MRRYVWVVCLWLGCHEPVEPPPAPPSSLLALTPELPGLNCPNGGTAIASGLDNNNDGILQAGEVDSTAFVCNGQDSGGLFGPVLKGSFTIQNELDLAAMNGVQTVTGNLTLVGVGLSAISLPDLEEVQGSLLVSAQGIATIDLPFLGSIGEDLSVFPSADLQELSLPGLLSVGRDVNMSGSFGGGFPVLQTLDIDLLQTVGRDVSITFLALPQDLSIPSLQSTGSLTIGEFPLLRTIDLPALQAVPNGFTIGDNPLLPTCQAQAILDQLTTAPLSFDISGNNAAGACP